ncbi:OHCU decarboxylase [Actinokineospora alba]|uniref:OHCU decarboxylase n=1 Tax=Actinokineospora alba TaxID=504798 RepID=A0A1H0G212_9PSEU|nr:2-oxo-4-hydroxy-4-carboxy-5-ureidoimidazoline decarboxylase [Actinokineospora alba]TDP69727.1 OHCU decarboxylase [Actinokineospora alba]SDI10059.1 OHCU decarboxylase [Actinokineospora alba]SDO00937.1 OHCU decarboxylase [Actinokineospora alba]
MSAKTRGTPAHLHPVDEVLPAGKLALYGFQHVLAFYAGAVIVPILLASAIGLSDTELIHLINADLFTCGIASIIQSIGFWKVGVRLPLLQGVTFTAVSPMIAIGMAAGGGTEGLVTIYGSVIVAGLFTFFIAPFFSKLVRFFPPVVTGTVISVIGIALLPVAANDAAGGNINSPDYASLTNLAYAGGTLAIILVIYRLSRGFFSTVAVLIGLVCGTLLATILGHAHFDAVASSDWFGVTTPFHFGWPKFSVTAIISMIVVMLITAVETTGDVFATGEIVKKRITRDDISRALRADGLATTLGGVLNSFPYTCFAENVGLVRLTRIKSRYVIAAAGGFMILIGLIPKAGAIVAGIPHPVLGGAGLAMFGTVAVVGFQTLGRVNFHDQRNVMVVAVSVGLALIPVGVPKFFSNVPDSLQIIVGSGITLGSLSAIFLNLLFNVWGGKKTRGDSVPATPDPEKVTLDEVNHMSREEFTRRFSVLFQNGPWIAEEAWSARPFDGVYAMRHAFHTALFNAPDHVALELIKSYPDLAGKALVERVLGPESLRDQCAAGLDRLTFEEYDRFHDLTDAYHEKFGFPLVICVRENTKETILPVAEARLQNSLGQERATALVEIAKIANLRLRDLVEEPEHADSLAISEK